VSHGNESSSKGANALGNPRLFAALLLVAAVLASAAHGHNENRTFDLLRALGHGRLTIDPDARNTVDKALVDGHYYSGGAPGLAFFLLPAFVVLERIFSGDVLVYLLTFLGAGVPLALGALGVRRAAAAAGAERPELVALAHALGTIALPFATRLYAHSIVVCLVAWSLALVLERKRLPLAGLLAAAAVACDYNVGLVAAALLGLAVARERGKAALFATGALGPAVLLGIYHTACFGAPWRTPYDFHADQQTRKIIEASYGFTWPSPRIFLELLVGTRRGLLFTQPVALAGLVGLALAARDKTKAFALGVAIVVLLSNAARTRDWHAGASFGARYTAAALPFLALGYATVLERLGRASLAVLVPSVAVALLGATADWGYDVITSADAAWIQGPRVGLAAVLCGNAPLATAVVSLVALGLLLPGVALILHRKDASTLGALALAGVLACLPGTLHLFFQGPDRVDERIALSRKAQFRRAVAAAANLHEAQEFVAQVWPTGDMELRRLAAKRVLDFDPEDETALEILGERKPPKTPKPPK